MNLRIKTLLILGLTLLGAIALILGLSHLVLTESYAGFEEKNTRNSVVQALKAIDYEQSLVESKCGEWSRWNETYFFVKGDNQAYIDQNLNPDSFENLDVDLLVFLNLSHGVVYATGYNTSSHQAREINDSELSSILSTPYLFSHDALISSRSGFLITGSDPLIVVSQPILTSTYDGPSTGYLIFGKYLDPEEIHKVSDITSLDLSIVPISDTDEGSGLDWGDVRNMSSITPLVQFNVSGPDRVVGSIPVRDITGTKKFLLQVTSDRTIYNQGLITIGSFLVLLVAIGLIFIVITLLFMDRLVLRRLAVLITCAQKKNKSSTEVFESPLSSGDELSELAQALIPVFDRVTRSETELLEALRKTEESERKYRELADSLPEFVFEVDLSGRLSFLNRLGFQVSGYTPKDLEEGLFARDLVALEDQKRLAQNMGRILAGERISGQEYMATRRDGTQFPMVFYTIRVLENEDVVGLRGFAIDITERKKMEVSNRKLADIVQHTQAGIITGIHDEVDVINPAYALMHGYTREEIYSVPMTSLFSSDLRKDFPAYLRKAELYGHFVFEADHQHRDGTLFPTLNDLTLISDMGGMPYWILNVQDITEHRLAWKILMESESLRESHRQIKDVLSRLPDATFVVDKDGWVILWNAAMESLTKITEDQIIGRGQQEYAIPFYGYKRPMLLDLILKPALLADQYYTDLSMHDGTLSTEEYLPKTVNGPMYLSIVANPLFDSQGRLIGAVQSIRDVSSRKLVEEALMRTNEKLNLLSSITRHDIRNRITVLFGILPIIKRMSTNPEMTEMVEMLEKAAYTIRDQIEFTGDYQDMGVHAPEWREIGEMLDQISKQGLVTDGVIENKLHGLSIYADPLLERVFYNLIDNAGRHGGHVSHIRASYVSDDKRVIITIEDDGTGIPYDLKERIFERGYGKNTGLGLFLVREILSITGITIKEIGISGSGACFEIVVPDGCYRIN
ncbi:PAS domain S-box protein [Methanospirillum lacunae]|uniref:histidine kinase n=1 Tax=Methanospirillum lacunae TaxID=668570 RepID=A0A2V2MZ58_9EURY|nr:PAS domain S-box protein [Methanospirillum lacunae]PWR73232.1 hypothetical protein DK846_05255 [Methanospirillum lacunae]